MVSIPLYIYIYHYTHTQIHTHTQNIFFIHSSIDGPLGCFHILSIEKNDAMNTGMHISFQSGVSTFFFFSYIPRSVIARPYSSSIFSFLSTFILFSTVAAPIYISINKVLGFPFLHFLANICYL